MLQTSTIDNNLHVDRQKKEMLFHRPLSVRIRQLLLFLQALQNRTGIFSFLISTLRCCVWLHTFIFVFFKSFFLQHIHPKTSQLFNEAVYTYNTTFWLQQKSEITLPPNQDAQKVHIKRANYQAGVFWTILVSLNGLTRARHSHWPAGPGPMKLHLGPAKKCKWHILVARSSKHWH